jgi:hypothetical protein
MNSILAPTIDLFLYDLRNSLGDVQEGISKNRKQFLQKIPSEFHEKLAEESERDFDVEYVYLLKERYACFESKQRPIKGYYYPIRLGDTYGLLVECTFQDKNQKNSTTIFATLKAEIQQRLQEQTATIGQTWVISGYLPQSATTAEEIEDIAEACYKQLMPERDWKQEKDGKGYFLDATIFELSTQRLAKKIIKIQDEETEVVIQDSHVIIILYPNESTLKLSAKFYSDWMRLFYYRHKILWAYGQSQLISNSMKGDFSQIQSISDSITSTTSQELIYIRQALLDSQKILNSFTRKLNILDFQTGTIDTNLSNYQKRLEVINQKVKEKTAVKTELSVLAEFSKLVTDKYLLQIKQESESFGRGLKLLENTNNAIRSRVEVERLKSDRNFQDLVVIVGTVTATVSLLKDGKNECKSFLNVAPNQPSLCNYTLSYSLVIGIFVGVLFWLLRKRSLADK